MNGARAIEPAMSLMASALRLLMKLLLAVEAGQVCHCRSSGFTDWPRPMSDLATRISVVGSCATGSAAAAGSLRSAGEIGGDAAGTESDGQDDDTSGIHTLYCLLLRWAPSIRMASTAVPTGMTKAQWYKGT